MSLPYGIYVIEDLFFHVGPVKQQNRGLSSVSPADYIAKLILRLFAGHLLPEENHGFMKYLFDKTDHVEIIRKAAVFWKKSNQALGLTVAEADRLIDTTERADGLNNLAWLLLNHGGDPKRAEVAVRKAMQIAPDLIDALSNRLSMIMERQGRWGEAIEMARRAVELSPRAAHYTNHLNRLLSDEAKRETRGAPAEG